MHRPMRSQVEYANERHTTKVISKTLNPEWRESFEFEVVSVPAERGLPLRFAMFDQDTTSADDFMGECIIFLNDFIDLPVCQQIQDWVALQSLNIEGDKLFHSELGENVVPRGDLLVSFQWIEKVRHEKPNFRSVQIITSARKLKPTISTSL